MSDSNINTDGLPDGIIVYDKSRNFCGRMLSHVCPGCGCTETALVTGIFSKPDGGYSTDGVTLICRGCKTIWSRYKIKEYDGDFEEVTE